jgi:hypothetical protein
MNPDTREAPSEYVAENEELGCTLMDHSLGFVRMPAGYHLMLDPDDMYFFGVRDRDGTETAYHWNKWAVYRWARRDAEQEADAPSKVTRMRRKE